MERLRKLREPAAIVLLAAIAAQLVVALVTLAINGGQHGLSIGSWLAADQLSRDLVLGAALALVSCAVWGRPSRHAPILTLLGAIAFGVQAALGLILTLIGMTAPGSIVSSITLLLEQLIPAASAVLSFRLYQVVAGASLGQPPNVTGQFPGPNRPPIPAPRSQSDQFGNPHSNSTQPNQDYRSSQQPPVRLPAGPADVVEQRPPGWQPVAHNGPQRLEPSPYSSPVGPHSRAADGVGDQADQRRRSADHRSGTDSQGGPQV